MTPPSSRQAVGREMSKRYLEEPEFSRQAQPILLTPFATSGKCRLYLVGRVVKWGCVSVLA